MSRRSDRLDAYRSKRDFRSTAEPKGRSAEAPGLGQEDHPLFVVQQHDATSMHWDLRLEVDGVLRSWAVPKGPSTDPRERRLAIATEDHPLSYADFEGVIPEDEYGAGTVLVWDAGPYENRSHDEDDDETIPIAEALDRGHAEVWLEGHKIRGGYALIHGRMRGEEKSWLLVKMDDEGADARRNPTSTEPRSVLSGRTLEEVAAEEGEADEEGEA